MDKQALINAQLAMRDREGHLEMLNTALFPFYLLLAKQDLVYHMKHHWHKLL